MLVLQIDICKNIVHKYYFRMTMPMILDFGLCKDSVYDKKTYSFCGTVEYMAPEVWLKNIPQHFNKIS